MLVVALKCILLEHEYNFSLLFHLSPEQSTVCNIFLFHCPGHETDVRHETFMCYERTQTQDLRPDICGTKN